MNQSSSHDSEDGRGTVFNIQRYSIHDGPGIRTTVFLKGCPLRCRWCHNPESFSSEPEIIVLANRCTGCGECVKVCPTGATGDPGRGKEADRLLCRRCGRCVEVCPSGARQWVGRHMTAADLMSEIVKDRLFYDDTGGGVTFSGGEPLAQPAFLRAVLERCRAEGIHTAVDTCGFCESEVLSAIVPLTDLFLYDVKHIDEARHRDYTGFSNVPILENLKALAQVHTNIWLRIPVIPGYNDDRENLEGLARLVATLPGVRQINLLPYHPTGVEKLTRLQQSSPSDDIAIPTAEELENLKVSFTALGLAVQTGG